MEATSSGGPVFADERQAQIAELVAVRGRVRISDLARQFDVTEPTIRKDLRLLHERGLVKRTHGGAISRRPLVDRELSGRETTNLAAKQAIARTCVGMLKDGDSVFLDSGTTVGAIAAAIAEATSDNRLRNLMVLTNVPGVASALAGLPNVEHVLLGGQLRRSSGAVVGALTLHNLQRFTVEIAFIGASGFSQSGVTSSDVAESEIKATVIERARRVVVPIDHSKIGASDFSRICGLEEIDSVVVDRSSSALEELCAAKDIELLIADA